MDHWDKLLPNLITPKSGPLPQMASLIDANRALIRRLPQGYLKRAHWLRAGHALMTAAETGRSIDAAWAYEAIVAALDTEGWLTRSDTKPSRLLTQIRLANIKRLSRVLDTRLRRKFDL
jgi:hypothetical protein